MLFDNFHLFLRYQLEEVGVSTSSRSRFLSGGQRTPFPAGHPGQPAAPRAQLLLPAVALLRHPRQPTVSHQRLVQRRRRRVRRADLPVPDPLHPLRRHQPLLLSAVGALRAAAAGPDGPGHQPRSPGRSHLRALLRGRHLRRPRLPALQPGPAHPRPGRAGPRRRPWTSTPSAATSSSSGGPRSSSPSSNGSASGRWSSPTPATPTTSRSSTAGCGRPTHTSPSIPASSPGTNPDSLRTSWGFGFRWFSPIGPLRFEWGLPFKPLRGEEPLIFEFTIGNDL